MPRDVAEDGVEAASGRSASRPRHGKGARVQRGPSLAAADVVAEAEDGAHRGGAAVADHRGYDGVDGVGVPGRARRAKQGGDAGVVVDGGEEHGVGLLFPSPAAAAAAVAKVSLILVDVNVRRIGGHVAVRVIRRVRALRHR